MKLGTGFATIKMRSWHLIGRASGDTYAQIFLENNYRFARGSSAVDLVPYGRQRTGGREHIGHGRQQRLDRHEQPES
ncbi:MAG: hypothetical protein J7K66_06465 [Anaerolineaceae bacterium]|nr:hypothetical protein [Anaerolineaceae bacterium]